MKDDAFECIDAIPVEVEDIDDVAGEKPAPAPKPGGSSSTALKVRSPSAGAVVPYQPPKLPALAPRLGDLEDFIRAANAAPILTQTEERELAIQLRDKGDLQAAQRLILSHLRLVVSIARGYLGYGLPHADLIQEGNLGLMKAIKHYDPDRGVRLMTFAVHWIRAEIQEYIVRNWRLVKLATTKNQRKLFFNLRQMKESDRTLTVAETKRIAATLDVKPEEVREMEARMSGGETPIDGRGGDDDSSEDRPMAPIEWLTDETERPDSILEDRARSKLAHESLRGAISGLDERSRRVIEARWLKEDREGNLDPMTLQELAAELGVSAERVRQIEKKALAKLRDALASQKEELED